MTVLGIDLCDLSVQVQLQLPKLILAELEPVLCVTKFNLHLVKLSSLEIVLSNELPLPLSPLCLLLSMQVLSVLPLLSQLLDLLLMSLLHGQLGFLSSPDLLFQRFNLA